MRILFTFVGGHGHFEPLAAIARAAEQAGHSVAFGCGAAMPPAVEAAGFRVFSMGVGPGRPPERLPLRRLDRAREDRDLRDRFVRVAARDRAPRVAELCSAWRPRLLVCDETDFGACVAAEKLGLPFATVQVIASGAFVRPEVVGEALDELRAEQGLPADPGLERLSRYLVVSPVPRSFRDPAHPLPATARSFRPPAFAAAPGASLDRSPLRPGAPTIYFTLGTVFNTECGDLAARVLAGLRGLPINLVVTVGHHVDPAELGPQPAHVRIERYLPQAAVLPHCDAVVSHGGSGSVIGALAHGLPSLLMPLGADQPLNADRCAALGVSRVLDPFEVAPQAVASALTEVLEDASIRRNAEGMRDEIAALPELASAVGQLERLAAEAPLRPVP